MTTTLDFETDDFRCQIEARLGPRSANRWRARRSNGAHPETGALAGLSASAALLDGPTMRTLRAIMRARAGVAAISSGWGGLRVYGFLATEPNAEVAAYRPSVTR